MIFTFKNIFLLFCLTISIIQGNSQDLRTVNIIAGELGETINVSLGFCVGAVSYNDKIQGISGITIRTEEVTVSNFGFVRADIYVEAISSKPEGVYNTSIEYTVSTDILGQNICLNETVEIEILLEGLPAPEFSTSTNNGTAPLSVQFQDESVGADTWLWDFGDGSISTDQNPQNTYQDVGFYDVKLIVTGPEGKDSTLKKSYIQVINWINQMGSDISSSPALGMDSTIYVGSHDNKLYAFNLDGSEKWTYLTGGDIRSSPAIDIDGTIYIGSDDNKLHAVNPDGSRKWTFRTDNDINSSPAIGIDGAVYVGSNDNRMYAINPDGSEKWTFRTRGDIRSSPSIGSDGTIYFGSEDGKIYAINPDGSEKWTFQTGDEVNSSPAIGTDGIIYIGSNDDYLYSLSPNGSENWSFSTEGDVRSSPAIGTDGTIYVGSDDNRLYAVNPDGTQRWSYLSEGEIASSPAIGSDGTVYVGSFDGRLYALNPDGSEEWSFLSNGVIYSSPTIGGDGTLYVGSSDGEFYSIPSQSLGLANTNWPKFGANDYNTHNIGELPSFRAPYPLFTATPSSGTLPLVVDFEDNSLYDPSSWIWNFGDGQTSTLQNPQHTYEEAGFYDVQLLVSSSHGRDSLLKRNFIQINKWSYKTGWVISSSPAIGRYNTIYFGSDDNNLYAINPDGSKKWSFKTRGDVSSSPAIGSDETIYVGSSDDNLYAINSDGSKKWSFETGGNVSSSPAIGSDGTIYVGSWDDNLYAINPDGSKKWSFKTGGNVSSSPAIGSDGTIYIGSTDDKLYAINPDGSEQWSFLSGESIYSSPAIGSDGTIYIGSWDKKLYALNPNGIEKWSFLTMDKISSSPSIGEDGTIYIGSWDKNLYALNPDGSEQWSFLTEDRVISSATIGSDGLVYIGSSDHKFYSISPEGIEQSSFKTSGSSSSYPTSATIGQDGTIYFGHYFSIYAISSNSQGLANSEWPKFGHDIKNTHNSNHKYCAFIEGNSTICKGDSTVLTSYGGMGYVWNTGDTSSSITISPSTTTNYSVTVTEESCVDSAFITVYVNETPQALIEGNSTICHGEETILTVSGDSDYFWSTGQTTASISLTPESTTEYLVTVTNEVGCSNTSSFIVEVNELPIASINGDSGVCNGEEAELTASGGISYIWSTGQTNASISVTTESTSEYQVTVTDENGCINAANFEVMVFDLPEVFIQGNSSICFGEETMLMASGGSDYVWSSGQIESNITIAPENSKNYEVTVTDENGCSNTASILVEVKELPNVEITGTSNICAGEEVLLTASGGSQYLWSTGESKSSITISPQLTQEYFVTVTGSNGCIIEAKHLIYVDTLLETTIDISSNSAEICAGDEVIISSAVTNEGSNPTYQWIINGEILNDNQNTFHSSQIEDGDVIECFLLSSEICIEENPVLSNQLVFKVNPLPDVSFDFRDTVNVSEDTVFLSGGLPEGGIYSGDLVSNNQLILMDEVAGTTTQIFYTYVDENGCENTVSREVFIEFSTSVDNASLEEPISIFPNPTNQYLNIELINRLGIVRIQLYDITGMMIYKTEENLYHDKTIRIDFSPYSPGVYFLRLQNGINEFHEQVIFVK